MTHFRITLFGAALGFLVSVAPGCGKTCNASTCASGCCDSNDKCQAGALSSACGTNGAACQACAMGASCTAGTCSNQTSTGGGSAGGGSAGGGGGASGGGSFELPPADLQAQVARATCDALLRCCTTQEDLVTYFRFISSSERMGRLASLIPRVPPNATVTAANCESLMTDVFAAVAVGPWTSAIDAGFLGFNSSASRTCLNNLSTATCGQKVRDALFDSKCFGLAPPQGGAEQRTFVVRSSGAVSCGPVTDGFGALFYGTCDPQVAFCCFPDARLDGGCGLPTSIGTCEPVAPIGATTCRDSPPPFKLCASGVECTTTGCKRTDAMLTQGALCFDRQTTSILGDCVSSWCDVLGSGKCEPFKAAGSSCSGGEECETRACLVPRAADGGITDGGAVCGVNRLCVGN
jgi:hypothetical protein